MAGEKYKITYFANIGVAEPIRFILAYAGKDFTEDHVLLDDWPKIKPIAPFGKLPLLEINGKTIHQSKAICRYLAKQNHLAGSNDWEDLQIDIAVDTFDDLLQGKISYVFEKNETEKAAKLETLQKETMPFYLSRLEAQAKDNGGYLANGKLSWADIYFAARIKSLTSSILSEAEFAKYATLKAIIDKIYAFPKIAEFISNRKPFPVQKK